MRTRTPRTGLSVRLRVLLAAAGAVAALPLAAVLPAGAGTPSAVPGATVTQGFPPTVYGGTDPVKDSYDAVLPATVQGQVSAVVAIPPGQLPSGTTAADLAAHLHASCAIGSGAYQPCDWQGGPAYRGDLDGWLRLRLPDTAAAASITYRVELSADANLLPANRLMTGWIELTGQDGGVVADGVSQLVYATGLPDASTRGNLFAVDASGVLWRYPTTADSADPLMPRVEVGPGWGGYTAITPIGDTTADGTGNVVARDKDGVLWLYQGSGDPQQPFKPRVRVGAGWNIYTDLAGISADKWSTNGLLARNAQGELWFYRHNTSSGTNFFDAPYRVEGYGGWETGWDAYDTWSTFGSGVVARDADGVLWSYAKSDIEATNEPVLDPKVEVGPGWGGYTAFSPLQVSTSDTHGLVARDSSGVLWLYSDLDGTPQIPANPHRIGDGFDVYTKLF